MGDSTFDYIVIGSGGAGMHLILAMARDGSFDNTNILVIDQEEKIANDRTWSFWEKGKGLWDDIVAGQWGKGRVDHGDKTHEFDLGEYRYKTLRSSDFYRLFHETVKDKLNITWKQEKVIKHCSNSGEVETESEIYTACHVFDSRLKDISDAELSTRPSVKQHFKGWFIRTQEAAFDDSSFRMMDFRISGMAKSISQDQTFFTYVLPFNQHEALVEATFFSNDIPTDKDYDNLLKAYIKEHVTTSDYDILEVEKGIIPMSSYPLHKDNSSFVTYIGTSGGWVKPSTGYMFKNAERNADKIVENIKLGHMPGKGLISDKHRMYDRLLIDILEKENELGPKLFNDLYGRHPIQRVFRFLDEESPLWEDLMIIFKSKPGPFLRAIRRQFF